jgi:hypothetical protein
MMAMVAAIQLSSLMRKRTLHQPSTPPHFFLFAAKRVVPEIVEYLFVQQVSGTYDRHMKNGEQSRV